MKPMKAFRLTREYLLEHYPSRGEKVADATVHIVGLVLAAIGGVILLVVSARMGGAAQVVAMSLYALGLVTMLGCSLTYNMTRKVQRKPFLRRLDEAAIFVMIAGSYTPFTTQRFEGAWAISMTAVVWGMAAAGVAGKLLLPRVSEKWWVALYVAFGWVAVVALKPMINGVGVAAMVLLLIGGIVYTAGAVLFMQQKLPYRRAIWHSCVVAAAGIHYAAIMCGVALAGPV
jgi:hemolysin III